MAAVFAVLVFTTVLVWSFVVLAWVFWDVFESLVLRRLFNNYMSEKFGTTVTVSSIRVRRKGVTLCGLQVGNDPYSRDVASPYLARFRRLEIKTAGPLALLSCLGMTRFGSCRRSFVVGFLYCEIEQIVAEGLSLYVEEDNYGFVSRYDEACEEAKRELAGREAKMLREFRRRWIGSEDDEDVVYSRGGDEEDLSTMKARMKKVGEVMRSKRGISERRQALLDLREDFKRVDRDQRHSQEAARSQQKPLVSDLWRIGKIQILNSTLELRGVEICLQDYELRGFIGKTHSLRRKLLNAFIYDMANGSQQILGPHDLLHSDDFVAEETQRHSRKTNFFGTRRNKRV